MQIFELKWESIPQKMGKFLFISFCTIQFLCTISDFRENFIKNIKIIYNFIYLKYEKKLSKIKILVKKLGSNNKKPVFQYTLKI